MHWQNLYFPKTSKSKQRPKKRQVKVETEIIIEKRTNKYEVVGNEIEEMHFKQEESN